MGRLAGSPTCGLRPAGHAQRLTGRLEDSGVRPENRQNRASPWGMAPACEVAAAMCPDSRGHCGCSHCPKRPPPELTYTLSHSAGPLAPTPLCTSSPPTGSCYPFRRGAILRLSFLLIRMGAGEPRAVPSLGVKGLGPIISHSCFVSFLFFLLVFFIIKQMLHTRDTYHLFGR